MCNQFEGQTTVVLDQQTVRACSLRLLVCCISWLRCVPHQSTILKWRLLVTLQALQFYGLASENKWAQLGYESTFFALFFFLAWCAGCCFLCIEHSQCAEHYQCAERAQLLV